MKKNKMCRLASVLLILVLLTTSVVGSTFAKYVTEKNGTDTARVAKWGVTINLDSDLFKSEYKGTETGYEAKATVRTTDVNTNLVAPGTTGTGLKIASGDTTPEVSYRVTIALAEDATIPSLKYTPEGEDEDTYAPVKFGVTSTANGTETTLRDGLTIEQLKDYLAGVKAFYEYDVSTKQYYALNADGSLNTTALSDCPTINIKWTWDFTTGALNDELDTILGNKAAGGTVPGTITIGGKTYTITADSIKTDVNLNWTVTATQIN